MVTNWLTELPICHIPFWINRLILVDQGLSFILLLFSPSVVSDSLWPHELQDARITYFTISWSLLRLTSIESVMPSNHLILCRPLLLLPSIFPSIRIFSNELTWLFESSDQSSGASASAFQWVPMNSVFPMNIQAWFPLGFTGWMTLQSKGFSRVFSNTTVKKHQFFSTRPSLWYSSHIHTWLLEKP